MGIIMHLFLTTAVFGLWGSPARTEVCPAPELDTFTVLLSVVGSDPPVSNLPISVPVNTNLFYVLLFAQRQYPNTFSFRYETFPIYGHYVTCINSRCHNTTGANYWVGYDGLSGEMFELGIDEIYLDSGKRKSVVWKYEVHDAGAVIMLNEVVTGFEDGTTTSIKLSAANDKDATQPSVCNLPTLSKSGSSFKVILDNAKRQHPDKFDIEYDVDSANRTYVKSINGIENEGSWEWQPYDADTNTVVTTGLDDTIPDDGASYIWRYSCTCTCTCDA